MHTVWSRHVNERFAELGLDFLTGYVWGRAAALGEPSPAVVAATFAWFEPGLVTAVYGQARQAVPRATMVDERDRLAVESLSAVLAGEDVTSVARVLRAAVEGADGSGRPLFAGLAQQRWPDDPVGELWRATELVREHRGDSHTAAVLAAGLGPVAMNVLTELWLGMPLASYSSTRGWSEEAIAIAVHALEGRSWLADGTLTAEGRRAREEIEARTDAQEQPIIDALGSRLDGVVASLEGWSQRCIAADAFPPDPLKRAAG